MTADPSSFYRLHVFMCTNRRPDGNKRGSCAARGSEPLREYLKAKVKELGLEGEKGVRVNSAGCLDRCELGPLMVIYPEAVWYSFRSHDDIDEILRVHIVGGGRVDRLLLRPEDQPVLTA